MEGAALARKRELDVATFTAWHTARFALNGWGDKGRLAGNKTLTDILGGRTPRTHAGQAIAFFHAMKAKGAPVEIRRVPRNG